MSTDDETVKGLSEQYNDFKTESSRDFTIRRYIVQLIEAFELSTQPK